jgi:hypothetical protein
MRVKGFASIAVAAALPFAAVSPPPAAAHVGHAGGGGHWGGGVGHWGGGFRGGLGHGGTWNGYGGYGGWGYGGWRADGIIRATTQGHMIARRRHATNTGTYTTQRVPTSGMS